MSFLREGYRVLPIDSNLIDEAIAAGWQPAGGPFVDGNIIRQAIWLPVPDVAVRHIVSKGEVIGQGIEENEDEYPVDDLGKLEHRVMRLEGLGLESFSERLHRLEVRCSALGVRLDLMD